MRVVSDVVTLNKIRKKNFAGVLERRIPGRRKCTCQGPEVAGYLVVWRSVWLESKQRGE